MKKRAIIAVILPLLFFGAGCGEQAEQPKDSSPHKKALDQAESLSVEAKARKLRQQDVSANLLPVAAVLPDGHEEPEDGVERLSDETFGCMDRIGYVRVSRETGTGDVALDALNTLLAETRYTLDGGMINALPDSSLSVDRIAYTGEQANVYLVGDIVSPGVCADPRIKEQVEATIRQYHPDYRIFWDGSKSAWRCYGDQSGLCE